MATAQNSPEQNTEKYQAKIQEAWFVDAGWTDDYDTARKQAADSGKLMVGYFLRSYSF